MTQPDSSEKKFSELEGMLQEANDLRQTGHYEKALTQYQICLEYNPDCVEAYYNAVSLAEEQPSLMISLQQFGQIYNNEQLQSSLITTILSLQSAGKFEEALSYCGALCLLDPGNWMFPTLAGKIYLNYGDYEAALNTFNVALHLAPDNIQCRDNLLKTFYYSGTNKFDANTKHWVSVFLKEPDTVDIGVLARVWAMLLMSDPEYAEIMQGQQFTNYKDFTHWLKNLSEPNLSRLTSDFLLNGLRTCVVANIVLERLLTHLRRTLLEYSIDNPEDAPGWATGFALALAEQCFVNEYIYELSRDEQKQIEVLVDLMGQNDHICPLTVGVLACYIPLNSFHALREQIFDLSEILSARDRLMYQRVICQQIIEPEQEKEIKRKIKSFGTINNQISRKVRDQYESNPYPRWISTGPLLDDAGEFILPGTDATKKYNILVAGCATGHYPIKVSKYYLNSSITGIDLSLSSLAYGLRKAQEMKINNLTFLHGDILELENLKQTFDIIFSSGVLHHMENPEAGWQVLANILNPGGLMKIGLYSELERQHITDCRKYIIDNNILDNPDGIRKIRKIIAGLPSGHPFRKMMPFNDFYSMSMMRDLLFHVQEQCFTIARIQKALHDFDLEFLSFSMLMPQTVQQYRQMFPDDPSMTNLVYWDEFEHKYPDTFTGLYRFWCRKSKIKMPA